MTPAELIEEAREELRCDGGRSAREIMRDLADALEASEASRCEHVYECYEGTWACEFGQHSPTSERTLRALLERERIRIATIDRMFRAESERDAAIARAEKAEAEALAGPFVLLADRDRLRHDLDKWKDAYATLNARRLNDLAELEEMRAYHTTTESNGRDLDD